MKTAMITKITPISLHPEVVDYCAIRFPEVEIPAAYLLSPLEDEPHVATWQTYATAAAAEGAFSLLTRQFGFLGFPVQHGMSQNSSYRNVRGRGGNLPPGAPGLGLEKTAALRLFLQQDWAGTLPVISTPCRADFVRLVQSFVYQNEPSSVPDSMGAVMIAGFNNWGRIHEQHRAWVSQHPLANDGERQTVFQQILADRTLYQDRFLIVSEGPYSDVSAEMVELPAEEWIGFSNRIRLQHEMTHYLTKRVYGVMHTHILDETIADYAGIVAAWGHYRADWFLTFIGLEGDTYRQGARFQNYCQGLSPAAFTELYQLMRQIAANLQEFDEQTNDLPLVRRILALTRFSLLDLANPHVVGHLVSLAAQAAYSFS